MEMFPHIEIFLHKSFMFLLLLVSQFPLYMYVNTIHCLFYKLHIKPLQFAKT